MDKLINKSWLLIALLFTANCVNVSDDSERDDVVISDVKIDTLVFSWDMRGIISDNAIRGEHIFQSEAELTSFLELTELNNAALAHQPDFAKWTYFALAGPNYMCTINISYEGNTATINYVEYSIRSQKPCENPPCPLVSAQPFMRVIVHFIPFTDKTIEFVKTHKPIDEWPY